MKQLIFWPLYQNIDSVEYFWNSYFTFYSAKLCWTIFNKFSNKIFIVIKKIPSKRVYILVKCYQAMDNKWSRDFYSAKLCQTIFIVIREKPFPSLYEWEKLKPQASIRVPLVPTQLLCSVIRSLICSRKSVTRRWKSSNFHCRAFFFCVQNKGTRSVKCWSCRLMVCNILEEIL